MAKTAAILTFAPLLFSHYASRMWWLVRVIFVPPLLHCYWMTEENVTVTSAAIYVACHADAIFKYIVLSFEAIGKKKKPWL